MLCKTTLRRGLRTQDAVALRQENKNSRLGYGRTRSVQVHSQVVLFGRRGLRAGLQHHQPRFVPARRRMAERGSATFRFQNVVRVGGQQNVNQISVHGIIHYRMNNNLGVRAASVTILGPCAFRDASRYAGGYKPTRSPVRGQFVNKSKKMQVCVIRNRSSKYNRILLYTPRCIFVE